MHRAQKQQSPAVQGLVKIQQLSVLSRGRESVTAAVAAAAFATTATIAAAVTATWASTVGAAETAAATFTATAVTAAAFATAAVATAAAFTTATVATAAAFTTTAVTAAAFTTTAAKAATATETTGAGRTCFHWAGFVDHHIAATQRLTVHAIDRSLRFVIAAHFHKAEAFGAARVTFHHDFGAGDNTEFTESLFQIAVTNRVRQVADVKFVAHERDSSKHRDKSDGALKAHSTNLETSEGRRN